jgi:hypothetical protein
MLHAAILFVLFYAFWILMSGFFTPFLLAAPARNAATTSRGRWRSTPWRS